MGDLYRPPDPYLGDTRKAPPQSVPSVPRVSWTGASGVPRMFELHAIGTTFNPVGGVYIFCGLSALNVWIPIYIGQTENFKVRLTDGLSAHHRIADIRRFGATHICAAVVTGGQTARLFVETDLRRRYKTPCNLQ